MARKVSAEQLALIERLNAIIDELEDLAAEATAILALLEP